MSSIQEQQLAKRHRDEKRKFNIFRLDCLKKEIDTSVKSFLSEVFSQWRAYKRFYVQLAIIQRFMKSLQYNIIMRILKKNHREPDSETHSVQQIDSFIRMEQNRKEVISLSRDLKNNEWTRLKVFLLGFVRRHSPVVNEQLFIQKMSEMLSQEEFDCIRNLMGNQSFIEFFESTRYLTQTSTPKRISGLLWILYYLSSERLPKSWFPNPESDFALVFEELLTIVSQKVQEEEEYHRAIIEMGPPEQPDYYPEPCPLCGCETIDWICFNPECMRSRESACPSCENPILEERDVVERDGMRFHKSCLDYNQLFRDHPECSVCRCSSNDISFVEGFGFLCNGCISLN